MTPFYPFPSRKETRKKSELPVRHFEGIPPGESPGLEPLDEPAAALLRRPVGERIRHNIAARRFLQTVVAHRFRRVDRLLDVAFLEQIPALLRVVGPDARSGSPAETTQTGAAASVTRSRD